MTTEGSSPGEKPEGVNQPNNWQRAVLHLDMDAFFVNVHRLEHPEDAQIPLAVGGRAETRGVIASASYEARQFGVRSAMPSATAMRLCPQLKIVGHNWSKIHECSAQVMAILETYGPAERVSVDEAFVDLTTYQSPHELAKIIQNRVKEETGLPASVGLATSKLVAKVASDHEKPEGCTIVLPGKEEAFLGPLSVQAIWGIGPRTAEKLAKRCGVHTCHDLAAADPLGLQKVFGKYAESLQQRAKGIDERQVKSNRGLPKSISQERTFNRDLADAEQLKAHLEKMSVRVAHSLQKRNLIAKTVKVKFRWADFTTFTRQRSVEAGIDTAEDIYRLATLIWEEHWPENQPMRLLGVGVSNLDKPELRQFDFGF